jgi:HPt (histidine-containing phosphotransfer) domain-containing protein
MPEDEMMPVVEENVLELETWQDPVTLPFNVHVVIDRLMAKKEIILQVLDTVDKRLRASLAEVRTGLEQLENDRVRVGLHAIKGSAGTIAADVLLLIIRKMEESARIGDVAAVEKRMPQLNREIQRCLDFIPRARNLINALI